MRALKSLLMLCFAIVVIASPLTARADDWNKATKLTFNAPVEIPRMVLGPGTYVFRLMDTLADRNVVQVLNADESHLYENVLAIPAYRDEPTDKTVVIFDERARGVPEAVKEWFYPGDRYGQEFVYPKTKTTNIAETSAQNSSASPVTVTTAPVTRPQPATPELQADTQSAAAQQAPLSSTSVVSKTTPVQIAQATTPSNSAAASPAKSPTTQKPSAKKLPKTAGPVPDLILIGLLSLGVAAGAHRMSRSRK